MLITEIFVTIKLLHCNKKLYLLQENAFLGVFTVCLCWQDTEKYEKMLSIAIFVAVIV